MDRTERRTPRLLLSPPRMTDLPCLLELADDPYLGQMTLNIPHPYTEESAIFWLNLANQGWQSGDKCIFAIRAPETELFLGGIGLHVNKTHRRGELGYWIGAPYRGQGFVTEAAAELIHFGFAELDLLRIQATHLKENPASGKVMTKNGMQFEGTLEDYYIKVGKSQTVRQYRILRREWEDYQK